MRWPEFQLGFKIPLSVGIMKEISPFLPVFLVVTGTLKAVVCWSVIGSARGKKAIAVEIWLLVDFRQVERLSV